MCYFQYTIIFCWGHAVNDCIQSEFSSTLKTLSDLPCLDFWFCIHDIFSFVRTKAEFVWLWTWFTVLPHSNWLLWDERNGVLYLHLPAFRLLKGFEKDRNNIVLD